MPALTRAVLPSGITVFLVKQWFYWFLPERNTFYENDRLSQHGA